MAIFEELLATDGEMLGKAGFTDYPHYHSRIQEVLGVAQGGARVGISPATAQFRKSPENEQLKQI